MPVRAVGFDLDGTLAVPARSRRRLLAEAVDAVPGVEPSELTREAYLEAHAGNLTARTREPVFRDALPRDSDADPGALAAAYREAITTALEPVDGVGAMLADLRGEYRVGLLTNGPVRAQEVKLDALGWWDAFDVVCISGHLPAGKPDVRAFQALLDRLDIAAARTAFVGDQPDQDIAGAAAAGLAPVQVIHSDGPAAHPRAVATVDRERLAADLSGLLAGLDG